MKFIDMDILEMLRQIGNNPAVVEELREQGITIDMEYLDNLHKEAVAQKLQKMGYQK